VAATSFAEGAPGKAMKFTGSGEALPVAIA
jgi:hypothetical protein